MGYNIAVVDCNLTQIKPTTKCLFLGELTNDNSDNEKTVLRKKKFVEIYENDGRKPLFVIAKDVQDFIDFVKYSKSAKLKKVVRRREITKNEDRQHLDLDQDLVLILQTIREIIEEFNIDPKYFDDQFIFSLRDLIPYVYTHHHSVDDNELSQITHSQLDSLINRFENILTQLDVAKNHEDRLFRLIIKARNYPVEILEETVSIFEQACKDGLLIGRSAEKIFVSCLYIACRTNNYPLNPAVDLQIFDIRLREFYKNYHAMLNNLSVQINIPLIDPGVVIDKIARELNLGVYLVEASKILVNDLINARKTIGKDMFLVCGNCIYVVCKKANYRITQEAISKSIHTSKGSLRKMYYEFSEYYNENEIMSVPELGEVLIYQILGNTGVQAFRKEHYVKSQQIFKLCSSNYEKLHSEILARLRKFFRDQDKHLEKHVQFFDKGTVDHFLGLISWFGFTVYDKALEFFKNSLDLRFHKLDQLESKSNIASMYYFLKDFETSNLFNEEIIREYISSEQFHQIAFHYKNMAINYLALHQFKKSEELAVKAVKLSRKQKQKRWEAESLETLAKIYQVKGDTNKALRSYEKAFLIRKKGNYKTEMAYTALKICLITDETDKYMNYVEQIKSSKSYLTSIYLRILDKLGEFTPGIQKKSQHITKVSNLYMIMDEIDIIFKDDLHLLPEIKAYLYYGYSIQIMASILGDMDLNLNEMQYVFNQIKPFMHSLAEKNKSLMVFDVMLNLIFKFVQDSSTHELVDVLEKSLSTQRILLGTPEFDELRNFVTYLEDIAVSSDIDQVKTSIYAKLKQMISLNLFRRELIMNAILAE